MIVNNGLAPAVGVIAGCVGGGWGVGPVLDWVGPVVAVLELSPTVGVPGASTTWWTVLPLRLLVLALWLLAPPQPASASAAAAAIADRSIMFMA